MSSARSGSASSGSGFFCWLLFNLAVYALPFFAGLTAGLAAYHSGAGGVGGILVGFFFAGVTVLLALGQVRICRCPLAPHSCREGIALMFAAPATVAGYHATLGLRPYRRVPSERPGGRYSRSSARWGRRRQTSTGMRMTVFADPLLVQGETVHGPRPPVSRTSGDDQQEGELRPSLVLLS